MTTFLAFLFAFAGQQVATPPPEGPTFNIACNEPSPAQRAADDRAPRCATLSGRIVRAVSNTGIAYAKVTLSMFDDPTTSIDTIADASGNFSFPPLTPIPPNVMDLREGYSLSASADGFVPAVFGQVGPNTPGEIINLTRGQRRANVMIRLNPVPTVSGTVHTTDSRGIAAALMRAYRIRYSPLGRRMKIAHRGLSNDLGDYRLPGVDPGDYYVSASYNEQARLMPLPGMLLTPNLENPDGGFVTGYFPAVTTAYDSTAFTVVAESEKINMNITLKDAKRFKVHVHVYAGADSQLHHFNIALLPAGADVGDIEDYAIRGKSGEDFDITDVGLGRYSLVAFDKSRILSEAVSITVDHDQEVKIPVYEPVDVSGLIVDENGNPVPGNDRGKSVRLVRADAELGQTIRVDLDSGDFVMRDLGPGEYDVYVDGLPFGTYIDDVQFPIPDTPPGRFGTIRITPDKPKRVFDEATQRWRTVSVIRVVLKKSNAVVVGWTCNPMFPITCAPVRVVLMPDHEAGNPFVLREDRYVIGRTNKGGFFRFVGVPPGRYVAFAFDAIPPGLYFDSQFYERIAIKGVSATARIDKAYELTACTDYTDEIYKKRGEYPPPDAGCMIRIPAAETVGIAP